MGMKIDYPAGIRTWLSLIFGCGQDGQQFRTAYGIQGLPGAVTEPVAMVLVSEPPSFSAYTVTVAE